MNPDMLGKHLQDAVVIDSSNVKGKIYDRGSTVPTDGTAGYAECCLFAKTGNTDESDQLFCNIGSASSCNFNAVTIAGD